MSTPGRKKPHCRTCGLPRLGHKRGKCDGTGVSTATPSSSSSDVNNNEVPTQTTLAGGADCAEDLTLALTKLRIQRRRKELRGLWSDSETTSSSPTSTIKGKPSLFRIPEAETAPRSLEPIVGPEVMLDESVSTMARPAGDADSQIDHSSYDCTDHTASGPSSFSTTSNITWPADGAPLTRTIGQGGSDLEEPATELGRKGTEESDSGTIGTKAGGSTEGMGDIEADDKEFLRFLQERSKKPPRAMAMNMYIMSSKDVEELGVLVKKLNNVCVVMAVPRSLDSNVALEDSDVCVFVGQEINSVDNLAETDNATTDLAGKSTLGTVLRRGAVGAVATWMLLASF